MRNPRRIKLILGRLARAWEMNPDLRLGQLLIVAATYANDNKPLFDIFNIEDDELEKGINEIIRRSIKG